MTTPKKSALGKGLSALLSNSETDVTSNTNLEGVPATIAGSVTTLPVSSIEINPFQPRTDFDESALNELAESIKLHGIIQPITVRKMGYDKFQIISGERRFRASQLAGLDTVPVYIRIANDQSMLEMALVENIQRENLNPIEVGISFKRLLDECNLSQEQLAEKVGKDRSTVTNYIRLLKLPPQIQSAIKEGLISMGHARALVNVDEISTQLYIFGEIIKHNLSVRKVEQLVRSTSGKKIKPKNPQKTQNNSYEYKQIQNRLGSYYETKVEIQNSTKGSGKIILSYYSTDDLNRLLDMMEG